MSVYTLLRKKKRNIIGENFKRKQVGGCNISNLGVKTCEHSVIGRKPVVLRGYKSAKV